MDSFPPLDLLGSNLLAAVGFMGFVWLLSLPTRNASLADIFWGPGFVLLAWLSFAQTAGYPGRKLLLALLTTICWGRGFRGGGRGLRTPGPFPDQPFSTPR